jgi:Zn-dependent M28 family amino/carboxypeptidase
MKKRRLLALVILLGAAVWGGSCMLRMPGRSHAGPLPPLTEEEAAIRGHLERHVGKLADEIGERNLWRYEALEAAALYVEGALRDAGYPVNDQVFTVENRAVRNVEAAIAGSALPDEIVLVGAHYDSVSGSPGANDNATGVAGLLEIARLLKSRAPERTVRFVAFVNEEPPFFQTGDMGSQAYARRARERGERIVAMISVETIGYYDDGEGTQRYPPGLGAFFPDRADFISFVGNTASRKLVQRSIGSFRTHTRFPSEGIAAPAWIPGIGWSDQWAFWQEGFPAIMVTDTALFRYGAYHTVADTPEKIDYARTARVVAGLARVVADLASR